MMQQPVKNNRVTNPLTWEDYIGLFVAVVCGATQRVNAAVVFGGWGTDEGSVSWYQIILVHTLALLGGHPAA